MVYNIESRDVNDVKINVALYSLTGHRRCSAVNNVFNISNELFIEV